MADRRAAIDGMARRTDVATAGMIAARLVRRRARPPWPWRPRRRPASSLRSSFSPAGRRSRDDAAGICGDGRLRAERRQALARQSTVADAVGAIESDDLCFQP